MLSIKLEINQGYTTMDVQPIIKTPWHIWKKPAKLFGRQTRPTVYLWNAHAVYVKR